MLLPETQMHIITFIFVSIELVIFFYLIIYKLARPDDKKALLNILLIFFLMTYNITGGILPDPKLPGSFFVQEAIAYGTGFITPCYFPYYVYKAFGLEKMRFHAYKGVFLFLLLPYFLFIIVYAATGQLDVAKNLLILPVLYALWIIHSLLRSIKFKYGNKFITRESKEELTVLFLSITPWIGLPAIAYFDLGQPTEAPITNLGFLLLFALQVNRQIKQLRKEHQRLIASELRLLNWNTRLKEEVSKRTKDLEKINEQRMNTFIKLVHETKTPLTLINNYLEEYITKKGNFEELSMVKRSISKISTDILNLFDLERFNKGIIIYNHEQVSDFSEIIRDMLLLFRKYADKRKIEIKENIESDIFIKADPLAINRIVNNLIENAIKFSSNESVIEILLQSAGAEINFSIKDSGIGIPPEMHQKVFQPYYQVDNKKGNSKGMGLGLSLVKRIVQDLNGTVTIESNPSKMPGTKIMVTLDKHTLLEKESAMGYSIKNTDKPYLEVVEIKDMVYDESKATILLVEDNVSMVNYLIKKLGQNYNIYSACNGNEALTKMRNLPVLPDLIISDVMMDKMDGFTFAKIISNDVLCNHIPFIFLSAKSTKQDKLLGLKLGAIDFIQKPFSIQELIQKMESVLRNVEMQKKLLRNTALKLMNQPALVENNIDIFEMNCNVYNLTSRERDIAKLICQGYKYKNIGETLFIAERTVTKHAQNIFEKTEVKNKIELINKLEARTSLPKQLYY